MKCRGCGPGAGDYHPCQCLQPEVQPACFRPGWLLGMCLLGTVATTGVGMLWARTHRPHLKRPPISVFASSRSTGANSLTNINAYGGDTTIGGNLYVKGKIVVEDP